MEESEYGDLSPIPPGMPQKMDTCNACSGAWHLIVPRISLHSAEDFPELIPV